jgi:hypothetical protein
MLHTPLGGQRLPGTSGEYANHRHQAGHREISPSVPPPRLSSGGATGSRRYNPGISDAVATNPSGFDAPVVDANTQALGQGQKLYQTFDLNTLFICPTS